MTDARARKPARRRTASPRPVAPPAFIVRTRDGREVRQGDQIVLPSTGETWTASRCTHPRKLDAWQPDGRGGQRWATYYANVWDVEIVDPVTGEVTFSLSTL